MEPFHLLKYLKSEAHSFRGFTTSSEKQYACLHAYSSSESGGKPRPRGFTLVEMLVVLSIIIIITTIALLGQSSFNRSIVLTDTAYTLAFSIREAQSLGLSTRNVGSIQNAGYGVHFANASRSSYIFFADTNPATPGDSRGGSCPSHTSTSGPEAKPGDCTYSSASEIIRTYTFGRGLTISNFCGTDLGSVKRCAGYLDSLNIVFVRPDTQSIILGMIGSSAVVLTDASITLSSPDGSAQRCVAVTKVGQVSVQNGVCP